MQSRTLPMLLAGSVGAAAASGGRIPLESRRLRQLRRQARNTAVVRAGGRAVARRERLDCIRLEWLGAWALAVFNLSGSARGPWLYLT